MLRHPNFLTVFLFFAFSASGTFGCGGAEFELDGDSGAAGSRSSEGDSGKPDVTVDPSIDTPLDAPAFDTPEKDTRDANGTTADSAIADGGDATTSDHASDALGDPRDASADPLFPSDSSDALFSDRPLDGDSSSPTDGQAPKDTTSETSGDATLDAPTESGISDGGCAAPSIYYRDKDGDGVGDSKDSVTACAPPSSQWVLVGGDCRDDLPNVKPIVAGDPNPPIFSGAGYADGSKPQGLSFDYDCSGNEEADPNNVPSTTEPDCSLLGCSAVGYIPLNPARTGTGINTYCSSTSIKRCKGLAVCSSAVEIGDPYRCR